MPLPLPLRRAAGAFEWFVTSRRVTVRLQRLQGQAASSLQETPTTLVPPEGIDEAPRILLQTTSNYFLSTIFL